MLLDFPRISNISSASAYLNEICLISLIYKSISLNKFGEISMVWEVGDGSNSKQLVITRIPSRELTYPTLGKGNSSSKCHFWGDMLVPCMPKKALDFSIFLVFTPFFFSKQKHWASLTKWSAFPGFIKTRQIGQKILPSDIFKEGDLVDVHGMDPQCWVVKRCLFRTPVFTCVCCFLLVVYIGEI